MKACDGKGWDLQLQRPAVPHSCPGPVHGAQVSTEQAGLVGMVLLSTAQASVLEKQDRLWWGFSWPEMPRFHCHQHHSELRCANPSLQLARSCPWRSTGSGNSPAWHRFKFKALQLATPESKNPWIRLEIFLFMFSGYAMKGLASTTKTWRISRHGMAHSIEGYGMYQAWHESAKH